MGVVYLVYFIPGEKHFGNNPDYRGHIKEFGFNSISPVPKDAPPPPRDIKIKYTILAILKEYIDDNIQASIVYVCDYGDGRQGKRSNLFSRWYDEAEQLGYKPEVSVTKYVASGEAEHKGKTVETDMVLLSLDTCVYKNEFVDYFFN